RRAHRDPGRPPRRDGVRRARRATGRADRVRRPHERADVVPGVLRDAGRARRGAGARRGTSGGREVMSFVVTIDGPAAAGKSTTARAIAQRLGWRYLDSGAFYRALALKALRARVVLDDASAAALAQATAIRFSGDPAWPHLVLDGEDVTEAI